MSMLDTLTRLDQRRRQKAAARALAAMVEARRNSPEIISYVKHRQAALKGCRP